MHIAPMSGADGVSAGWGHAGQGIESVAEEALSTIAAGPSCVMRIAIGIAAAANICPTSPMPKATSNPRARQRLNRQCVINAQIAPAGFRFKAAAILTRGDHAFWLTTPCRSQITIP